MNITIIKCLNGYIVTKYHFDNNGIPLKSYGAFNQTSIPAPSQEQFIFTNLEDFLTWFKTNAVLDMVTK